MARTISPERKLAYYIGIILTAVGVILFISTFFTSARRFGDFSNFQSNAKSDMTRALSGMVLMIVGQLVRAMGARGLAGSGVVLDPGQAREELEPYSRMAGGMVKDALDEADINLSGTPQKVIMIKCPACGKLNAEDAKFCQECGKKF